MERSNLYSVFNLRTGHRMVPVAAITTRLRRGNVRRDGTHLEHDNRSTFTLVDDAVANNITPMVTASKGIPYDTWVPNERGHDPQLSQYGQGD